MVFTTDKINISGYILIFSLIFSTIVYSHEDVDLTTLQIPIKKSFHLMNIKTGKQIQIRPKNNHKIRIVGQKKGSYIVRIIHDGVEKPTKYLVAKKWARKALNFMAAIHIAKLHKVVAQVGIPIGGEECRDSHHAPEVSLRPIQRPDNISEFISEEDSMEPDLPRTVTSHNAWKPGCEVLEKGKELKESDEAQLKRCMRAIQLSITKGTRNRNGRLNRALVFKNIFKRLKPEEQDFAAKVFTVHGEVGFLAKGGNYQEMMGVMKVLDNRARNSNFDRQNKNGKKPFNSAHMALDPWQFSMYNSGERLWEDIIDPGNSSNFTNAVRSFVKYQKAKFEPDPEMNHVYHYHANYMLPAKSSWGGSFRANHKQWEVAVKIDGAPLRSSPRGLNEGSSTDRQKISRNRNLQRHRFYLPIDRGGRVSSKDNWLRKVEIPWD
ncbi:MAG: hypothetical protein ACJAT2_000738 [Bacteriovoracaceae bacterium]|jgi:hypothetical protein